MTGDLEKLAEYGDSLRLTQAGALLHNLGKVTSQFLDKMINDDEGSASSFKYQHILHLIETDWPALETEIRTLYTFLLSSENKDVLDDSTIAALKQQFTLPTPFNDRPYRPGDMIEYLGVRGLTGSKKLYGTPSGTHWIFEIFEKGSRLTHLMNRAHRGASGGEKQDICVRKQTNINDLYRATPFGRELQAPSLNDIDYHKCQIEKIIQTHLGSTIKPLNFNDFANELRPHLEVVIADTQRPLNDVTVWDIGHSGMAFLLTQTIERITRGQEIEHDELAKTGDENTLFWRVLGIRLDGLDYLEGAPSLADMRVRYRLLQEAIERVRQVLEGVPVAIEVYRDENGSFYVFPDLHSEQPLVQDVQSVLQSELTVDGIALNCIPSGQLVNHPDDKGTCIGEYICEQINSESEIPKVHNLTAYAVPWQSSTNREICMACGIRPHGYGADQICDYLKHPDYYADKARRRKLCCICMDQRRGVAERWVTKGLQDYTVWIDEVADLNGRVALVVGQFDLQKWKMWYPPKQSNSDAMTESQSFARIRRVWETTRRFWQDVQTDFPDTMGDAGPRLAISGNLNPKDPGLYHTYTLRLGGTKLSVVWDSKNQRFITAHNLKYLAEPTRLGTGIEGWLKAYEGHKIQIEEPTGYGSQNKEWGTITIKEITEIPHSTYTPAIPILAEPRTFMALVPADKALDVVSAINEKYEREMGKVRNRLPLHMGVVFAPYKTPLRAIMDAGRRMLGQTASVDGWRVAKKSLYLLPSVLHADPHFAAYVRLELTSDGRSAVWHVPLRMGDGKTTDEWYPYVFVEKDKGGEPPTGRKRMFEAPCPWNLDSEDNPQPTWLVHASDLQEGDVIYFTPATVDFQWLDTSGRRFEIAYDKEHRRLGIPRRPYLPNEFGILLTIWKILSDHLTSTQIHALRGMIETKREAWGISEEGRGESETFRQFCRDMIANIEWKKCNGKYPWEGDGNTFKQGWLDTWADYAVRGWLNDAIELYMQIMKEKPKHEKERSP